VALIVTIASCDCVEAIRLAPIEKKIKLADEADAVDILDTADHGCHI